MSGPQATQLSGNPLSRRHLLLSSALLAAACNRNPTFGNDGQPLVLRLVHWGYEPDLIRHNLERFATQYAGLRVATEAVDGDYRDAVSRSLHAGQPIDAAYVRETDLAAWVEAGWLEPLDGYSGMDRLRQAMVPQAAAGIRCKGLTYGLPYFTECALWVYDEAILQRAGIMLPPQTWDEVTQQALEIKRLGIVRHPIRLTYRFHTNTNINWWSMVYARGGSFFDENLNPVFHLPGSAAEQTLGWLLEGIHTTAIIHPNVLESSYGAALRNPTAFTIQPGYNFLFANRQEDAGATGTRRAALFPGNDPSQSGSVMWTRLYALPKTSKKKDAAWELLQYLGGRDREDRLHTPLFWFVNRSLGSAYEALYTEPQVQSLALERGLDLQVYLEQRRVARTHEAREVPWFRQWEHYAQLEVQRALLRQIPPREALERMAETFYALRLEWSTVTNGESSD